MSKRKKKADERWLDSEGVHYGIDRHPSMGGDLFIDLDSDGVVRITEEISDKKLRGILRFAGRERRRGEEVGRLRLQMELRQLLDAERQE